MNDPQPVYQYKGMTILFPILTEDSVGILCGQWKRKEGVWWEVQGRKCHYAGIEFLGLGDLRQKEFLEYIPDNSPDPSYAVYKYSGPILELP